MDISVLRVFDDYLTIGCRGGQLSIFRVSIGSDQNEPLVCEENVLNREEGHLKAVTYIDYMKYESQSKSSTRSEHLFITSGEDSMIKIWSGLKK